MELALAVSLGHTFYLLSIYLAAPGPSCSTFDLHHGIFRCCTWVLVPRPGVEPGPLHWELRVLATRPPGKFPSAFPDLSPWTALGEWGGKI